MVSLPLSSSCWLGRSCDGIGTTVWDPEPGMSYGGQQNLSVSLGRLSAGLWCEEEIYFYLLCIWGSVCI